MTEQYTKYERAKLIGARALQISMGAPVKIELTEELLEKIKYSPIEIAKLELEQGVIPLRVIRDMPSMDEFDDQEARVAQKQEHI
ncbi:MAG: DNA-directed RNA polymerase subunit K [Candidatus Woesearchaeota archaeon]